jgi:3-oxoacyl-(acyl-carrier-protein) synthase/SAM-dependent methyltransferase
MYSTSYLQRRAPSSDPLAVPGGLASMVANRTSFVFDWRGPSETVDTACSSGLVAVHRALRALRSGECEVAVVGGVSLLLSDVESARLADLGVLAADGVCRAFDAAASGQARGEGVGVLVLKRLDLAKRDGDRVRAVVAGSAVSHAGGSAASLTLPSSTSQARAVAEAWNDAGAVPDATGYVEAHGAGTAHGDRSEVSALRSAFATLGVKAGDWRVGSVKPAIGSLDACGGIAGLISAVAAVEDGFRPALARLKTPAPDLDLEEGGLHLARLPEPWADPSRRAAAHAYGLGGVAAHVIVETAPNLPTAGSHPTGPAICPIFAWDAAGLKRQRRVLADWLTAHPDADLQAVSATLCRGREPMAARWVAVAGSVAELSALLRGEAGPLALGPSVAADDLLIAKAQTILDGADPSDVTADAQGVRLPGYAFAPTRFPIDGAAPEADDERGEVARYYDYVADAGAGRDGPIYLTLAPFPEVVPGFSWTRTMRDPAAHPEHAALMRAAQLEMRETLLADVPFHTVRRVLDIGCGFATDLIDLATAHPHLHGVGYTIAPAQARMAAGRVASAGLADRLEILNRNSAADPFPGPFDLAIGYEVGHHIEDKLGLFANLAQALLPGATLALVDCAADTAKPIHLPEVGSWTSTLADYADILARHGFRLVRVVDASREVGNFLVDPGLETMLAGETGEGADLVARVQQSWDGFGAALREGLIRYLLITAERLDAGAEPPTAWNRSRMGVGR